MNGGSEAAKLESSNNVQPGRAQVETPAFVGQGEAVEVRCRRTEVLRHHPRPRADRFYPRVDSLRPWEAVASAARDRSHLTAADLSAAPG